MQTSKVAESSANIESIYPLSPMQEGMLFHTLLKPASGIYLMQNRYMLQGDLDSGAFVRAWQRVMERHPILRTSFVWKTQKQPLQVVHKHIDVPMEVLDWRKLPANEQAGRLNGVLHAELQAGFDFGKAPLMRFRLIRLTEDTYEFVHSFHHILLDEWCTSLLMMDFLAHYEAFAQGKALHREAPRPYRDYIGWLQKQDLPSTENFWRSYLKGFASPTPVPFDQLPHGLTDQNADAGGDTMCLSADTTRRLVALARQQQLTLNTLVQAAWAVLLSHYSGERDVLFGVTVAGRPPELPGVEATVGLFINTLPLRVPVEPERPLVPWLLDLLAENMRLRQYEYTPLVQVQGWSEVPRGQTLFHSLLVFENAPIHPALREGRIVFKVRDVQYRVHTNYPLTVVAWQGTELGLKLSYDRRLFHAETIARMLGHLKRVLSAMAERPDARLGELPLLTDAERHQLVVLWNETGDGRSEQHGFAHMFEEQVRRTPDAPAVVCNNRQLSYADLNERANCVGQALMAEGVEADTVVALLDERGIDFLTMMLGVFKAGGAYLPLDPHHPIQRLAQVVELSRSPVILTAQGRASHLLQAVEVIAPERRPRVLVIEQVLAQSWPAGNPQARCTLDHLAYVIYTSGSTGVPKGAMVEHRGMLNNIMSKISGLGLTAADVIAQTASQCFDISVWQFLTALLCGARVHIIRDEVAHDPQRLLHYIDKQAVTIVETVPALMQGMLDAEAVVGVLPSLSRLRWLLPTGEALPAALCRRWLQQYPAVTLLNAYGPAECSDDVAVHAIRPPLSDDLVHVPIGRPIKNIRLYILNAFLAPVPVGVPGELCVAGVGVGRGYVNDPERTAAVFVPDPFSSETGRRLYKTGDLACYRPDGTIEFLGRRDHQVKVRGYRIELGEIEAQLGYHPDVHEAVVLAREDQPGEKRLVAYVVGHDGRVPDTDDLRRFLREKLPEYMVPSVFLLLDALPRTPNGKMDRHALPAPDTSGQAGRRYVGPRTATEDIITGIWAEVLGVERIGVHDHFFDLGGHSLLATQVVSRLRSAFQVELPLRAVFDSPTVGDLANAVEAARSRETGVHLPPLTFSRRENDEPLSFPQQRLWFLSQLEPDSAFYNIPAVLRLTGPLDIQVFEQGFNEVVRRHEALRTTIALVNGQPRQIIAPELHIQVPVADLRGLAEGDQEAMVRQFIAEETRRSFDLLNGPLLRVALARIGEQEQVLVLTVHHIIADGWSMTVLVHELTTLYTALTAGQPSPLAPVTIQYADFARWQRQWLQGEALESQLAYWRQHLSGAPPILELPTARPRPAVQSYRGARYSFTCRSELAVQLTVLSRRHGVTLFMTLLAAFQILLSRYTGQIHFCIGSPIANRTRVELEGLIGCFVNTLVLRADLSGNPRLTQVLNRVREVVLNAQAHQDLPFEQVVDAIQPERDLSHSPLFQVMFALQTPPARSFTVPGLHAEVLEVDPGTAKFDLSLEMVSDTEGLSGSFEYNTDLFDAEMIERMARHFLTVLEGIVGKPDARVSAFALLSEAERHQLLITWNATEPMSSDHSDQHTSRSTSALQQRCLHELVEVQAARTPKSVAVSWNGRSMTYEELNGRANQLAHYLREQGVGPESLVAICVERSLDMAVALLGVLKAGGAYVPLDPAYPAQRIAYIIEDTQAMVLLTHARLRPLVPASTARVVSLDEEEAAIGARSSVNLPNLSDVESLAYVIYTSGSTGRPKGVGITHRSAAALIHWAHSIYAPDDLQGVLASTSLCFDLSVFELFVPLTVGGRVILAENALALSTIKESETVTLINTVPSAIAELLRQGGIPVSAHTVNLAGEPLSGALVDQLYELDGVVRVFDLYGPSEDTTYSTYALRRQGGPATIGRPIANTQIYIVDAHFNPTPVGVAGELYIGGAGLARGYVNRPDLTAERFVPNPFSEAPGSRLYRTGDRARYRADGHIEYLGRLDHQVKLRGFRIELGEIEAQLREHSGVQEAVVQVREDRPGQKRLVAYAVAAEEEAPATDEVRRHLQARLPDYMVPSVIVWLPMLPLTPNGKVDRRALPVPEEPGSAARPHVAPRTPTEQRLAKIWAQVLGRPEIGMHDNFFELGGDSILSLQVIARAREAGLVLTPRQLFQHQTVAELAAVAECSLATGALPPATQALVTGPVPMTPIQQWFFEQAFPNPHHWNQAVLLDVRQPLVFAALQAATAAVVQQHDALRLRITAKDGVWRQEHAAVSDEPCVHRVDLSAVPADERRVAMERDANQWQASLHLGRGPVMRVVWFDTGAAESWLLLIVHHLVIDGVSWRILLEDLQSAYQQALAGQPIRLPAKTTSFQQWAAGLQAAASSAAVQQEVAYWRAMQEAMAPGLPVEEPSGARTEAVAKMVSSALSEADTHALLQTVPAAYRTQILDVLLTALAQTLGAWLERDTVAIALEGHGRETLSPELDVSRTIGWFTSLYPVVLTLKPGTGAGEALKAIKEQVRRIPNHGIGYGLLRYEVGASDVARHLREYPSPPVCFNYLGQFDQTFADGAAWAFARESVGREHDAQAALPYELDVNAAVVGGRLEVSWAYSGARYRPETIEALSARYLATLQYLIAHCLAPEAGGYTPSDFPDIEIGQEALDAILEKMD